MRPLAIGLAAALVGSLALHDIAAPAWAQTTGYVTGIPGRDPAGDDEIGWGPRYRPETSFAQPGTPPTPGQIAGDTYRYRTGRGVYDGVQAPLTTGAIAPYDESYGMPAYRPRPRVTRNSAKARREARRAAARRAMQ